MEESGAMAGYERGSFASCGKAREVYSIGGGPGVVVIHELPGITPQVAAFGRRIAAHGMTAVLPELFGTAGKRANPRYNTTQFARVCISREITCMARRQASPVTEWLRALCRDVHERCGGPGVGVVGMCATGGFALALLMEPSVLTSVLSQPSFPLPLTQAHKADLGISQDELAAVKARCEQGASILGLRFTEDRFCRPERFRTLHQEFKGDFEAIEVDSSPCNGFDIPLRATPCSRPTSSIARAIPRMMHSSAVLSTFERTLGLVEVDCCAAVAKGA